ncbi:hypothetical protein [Coleofasciculus sp. F4-SAH-05]|uniref:hypothetical protein n=1 Tax=Coleofasciculus sp. F4-SAH-05 TaxID=3069525 RepID=UPI0032F80573
MNDYQLSPSLESLMAQAKAVCSELQPEGDFYPFDSGSWIYNIGFSEDELVKHLALVLDPDMPLFVLYAILNIPELETLKNIDLLVRAIALANYGLLPGCFEMDLETGETRYRSVLIVPSNSVGTKDIAQLISGALLMAKTYTPTFQKIVLLGLDPCKAIQEIEN